MRMNKTILKTKPNIALKKITIIYGEETQYKKEYCAMLNRSIKQLEEGRGQIHEIIEVSDD